MSINEFIFDVMLLMNSGSCEVSASVANLNDICREGKQQLLCRNTHCQHQVNKCVSSSASSSSASSSSSSSSVFYRRAATALQSHIERLKPPAVKWELTINNLHHLNHIIHDVQQTKTKSNDEILLNISPLFVSKCSVDLSINYQNIPFSFSKLDLVVQLDLFRIPLR